MLLRCQQVFSLTLNMVPHGMKNKQTSFKLYWRKVSKHEQQEALSIESLREGGRFEGCSTKIVNPFVMADLSLLIHKLSTEKCLQQSYSNIQIPVPSFQEEFMERVPLHSSLVISDSTTYNTTWYSDIKLAAYERSGPVFSKVLNQQPA